MWTVSDPIFHLFFPSYFTICCGNSGISPLLCDLSKNIVFAPFLQGPRWSVKSHVPRKWPQVRVFPLVHFYLPAPWSSILLTQFLGSLLPWQLHAGQLVLVPWEGGSFSSPSSGPACPLLGYAGLNPSYWPGSQERQRGQLPRAGRRGAGVVLQGEASAVSSCSSRVWIFTRQCGHLCKLCMFRAVSRAKLGAPTHAPIPYLRVSSSPKRATGLSVTGCLG